MRRVIVLVNCMNIHTPLESGLGDWIEGSQETSLEDSEIVLIPGGSDVNPALYGHSKLVNTHINDEADAAEMDLISKAIEAGKFIIGICKGSQMLTVRSGGWLVQHVNGHHGMHVVETMDGKVFPVNSSHHQMSYPYELDEEAYQLLAWSHHLSSTYLVPVGDLAEDWYVKEPEVVWYPKIRGLAIQSHPEWPDMPIAFNDWLNELIPTLL